jgi:hypothetical protein
VLAPAKLLIQIAIQLLLFSGNVENATFMTFAYKYFVCCSLLREGKPLPAEAKLDNWQNNGVR